MSEENTIENQTLTGPEEKKEDIVLSGEEVKVIGEVIESIKDIYKESVENLMLKVGNLILDKIFQNETDSKHLARNSKTPKALLFKQLTDEIEKKYDKGESFPKKTWLYNSVRLVIDQNLLADCKEYQQLSDTHKITLMSIKTVEDKIEVAKIISNEKLSVSAARERISTDKKNKKKDIFFYINNPSMIEDLDDFIASTLADYLAEKKGYKPAVNKCSAKLEFIKEKIESYEKDKSKIETIYNALESATLNKKPTKSKPVDKVPGDTDSEQNKVPEDTDSEQN